jgi:hypothetical protein
MAMLVIGFALVHFGRLLARNETRFITEFVIRTVNGREIASPPD